MKKSFQFIFVAIAIYILSSSKSVAQMPEPVHMSFGYQQSQAGEATLIITAKIDAHWHVFSLDHKADIGLPIVIAFTPDNKNYSLDGKTSQPTPELVYDSLTKSQLRYFSNEVTFKQKVRIKSKKSFQIKGVFTYQACNDEGCLPPTDVEFGFDIKTEK